MLNVICGICGKIIKEESLIKAIEISISDKRNGNKRGETFNCCGRTWIMSWENKSMDCGPEIKQK